MIRLSKLSLCSILLIIIVSCQKEEKENTQFVNESVQDTLIVNPTGFSPLTAIKQFTTELATKSRVTIKAKTLADNDFILESDQLTRNHRTDILGLYANHDNVVKVEYLDVNDNVLIEQSHIISTDSLPSDFPNIEILTYDESNTESGFTLLSYWGNGVPHNPLIFDPQGNIRWFLDYSESSELTTLRYDNGLELLQNGNFYFGDINSNKIYEVNIHGEVINSWGLGNHIFHHNVQEKENGNFLITTSKQGSLHKNGSGTIEDYAIEIDRNTGTIIREWDLKLSLDETRDILTGDFGDPVDWFHGNAIIENKSGGIVVSGRTHGYVSLNNSNQVEWIISTHNDWDTNRRGESLTPFLLHPLSSSGQIISDTSILNGYQNASDFEWPWYGHAPFYLPNGNLMVFDNGDNRNFNATNKYSRAVEYEIDETNMTIKQVWEYGRNRGAETFGQYVSDVDFLPNTGNILFSPGFGTNNNGSVGGRVVEIEYATKNVVFEAMITPPSGVFVTFHRAERINLK